MADDMMQETAFGIIPEMTKIDAVDQLGVAIYMLRGVSDSLLALAEEPHDYQDVMRMLSDVTIHESQVLKRIEVILEEELGSKLDLQEEVLGANEDYSS